MSFYDTPVRRLEIVRACKSFVVAGALVFLSLLIRLDELGRILCFVLVTTFVPSGAFQLWSARQTSSDAAVTLFPHRAPVPEQVRFCRPSLWLSAFVFPVLAIWVAYDLHQLETGAVDHVRLVAPLGFVYEHFGYWTAVLAMPVLGLLCCAVFGLGLRKLINQKST